MILKDKLFRSMILKDQGFKSIILEDQWYWKDVEYFPLSIYLGRIMAIKYIFF